MAGNKRRGFPPKAPTYIVKGSYAVVLRLKALLHQRVQAGEDCVTLWHQDLSEQAASVDEGQGSCAHGAPMATITGQPLPPGRNSEDGQDLGSSTSAPSCSPSSALPNHQQEAATIGPILTGGKQAYDLEHLRCNALFGGVYEAVGLQSQERFAIKVMLKPALQQFEEEKASGTTMCGEDPLAVVSLAPVMRGHPNILELLEHWQDPFAHYCVFPLAVTDAFEEMVRRDGFSEHEGARVIQQAMRGVAFLHAKRLAHQDLSLENLLLFRAESNEWQVRIADPGQCVKVEFDSLGRGLPQRRQTWVGKAFRPPEVYDFLVHPRQVDAWCMGFCTFLLIQASALFVTTDPLQPDPEFGEFLAGRWQHKASRFSEHGVGFIARLMSLEPLERMSASVAQNHPWLTSLGRSRAAGEVSLHQIEGLTTVNKGLPAASHGRPVMSRQPLSALKLPAVSPKIEGMRSVLPGRLPGIWVPPLRNGQLDAHLAPSSPTRRRMLPPTVVYQPVAATSFYVPGLPSATRWIAAPVVKR